jgi:hypothetical protein
LSVPSEEIGLPIPHPLVFDVLAAVADVLDAILTPRLQISLPLFGPATNTKVSRSVSFVYATEILPLPAVAFSKSKYMLPSLYGA